MVERPSDGQQPHGIEAEEDELGSYILHLKGAAKLPHLNGTLLQHLVGTWRILRYRQADRDLATAGLIHSVYSTEFYKLALFSMRDRSPVQRVFGATAERLAYLFCTVDRRYLWKQWCGARDAPAFKVRSFPGPSLTKITNTEAKQLVSLECANHVEQCADENGGLRPFMAWALNLSAHGIGLFSRDKRDPLQEADESSAIRIYEAAVASTEIDQVAFASASRLNPYAAEPKILLAAARLLGAAPSEAANLLTEARDLLHFWRTPWDKRASYSDWMEFLTALERHAQTFDGTTPQRAYGLIRDFTSTLCSQVPRDLGDARSAADAEHLVHVDLRGALHEMPH